MHAGSGRVKGEGRPREKGLGLAPLHIGPTSYSLPKTCRTSSQIVNGLIPRV